MSEPSVAAGLEQRYSSRGSSTGSGPVGPTGSDERSPVFLHSYARTGRQGLKSEIACVIVAKQEKNQIQII